MTDLPVGSHTLLEDLDNCPHKCFHKHIAKDLPREEPSDALIWGRRIHQAFEARLLREQPLPEDMERYESLLALIESWEPVWIEQKLGMREDGSPCDFFAKDCYFRGVVDIGIRREIKCKIFDWKSGKRREKPAELEYHALLLKVNNPTLEHITGNYLWLQEPNNQRLGWEYDLSDFAKAYAEVKSGLNTIRNYVSLNEWPKKPNPLCDWCPVKTCEHWHTWKTRRG